MIVEYIRYEVTDPDAFVRGYEEARRALDASEHCLAYELSRCTEDPRTFVLRIEWDSVTGHLEGFRKSPVFAEFLAHVRPFIPEIKEMRHYEPTTVLARKS